MSHRAWHPGRPSASSMQGEMPYSSQPCVRAGEWAGWGPAAAEAETVISSLACFLPDNLFSISFFFPPLPSPSCQGTSMRVCVSSQPGQQKPLGISALDHGVWNPVTYHTCSTLYTCVCAVSPPMAPCLVSFVQPHSAIVCEGQAPGTLSYHSLQSSLCC